MQRFLTGTLSAAAAAAVMAFAGAGPAGAEVATPQIAVHLANPASTATNSMLTEVRWHGHRRWHGGWGVGAGFATGLLLGGALAGPYYYGYPYGYAYPEPEPYYYAPPPPDAVAWCERHYRSYDLRTGTFLGYDGYRHPCP